MTSHRHGSLYRRPGVVPLEGKVPVVEVEDRAHFGIENHPGQGTRGAGELLAHLVEVVEIDVYVSESVHEVSGSVAALLGHHHGQQGVRGDVERHSEEDVGTALVELAGEPPVGHVELEEGVAGGQGHTVHLRRIPGRDDVPPRVRIALERVQHLRELVDGMSVRSRPGTPLMAVDRTEVPVLVGPFVPDGYLVVVQVLDVGIALDEPQQFIDNRTQMQFLGRQQGKSLR